ncbi:restriction endonuclease subunit S [Fastidiosipila sanguinis]|uniref:Type I restriction modification DNA specificity domain-containing protein n=1 Tax=Fastidiosipila sanguinis TaxID=236753 RepID=A0A2S0KP31_9FIRM|nr:restriction endonuclease subunit S [Fastidiosipila sanguinis]AVM42768.1 hypothetical protein C5Q98_05880 [Fastidiosipila sanguinis]
MIKRRLGDIIEIKHGYAFDGDHIITEDNGIVLVTPGNFKIGGGFKEEKCKFFNGQIPDSYVLQEGDYIVTMTDLSKTIDTLGYSAKIPCNSKRMYLHNQRIGLIVFKDEDVCREYIYYVMQTHDYQKSIANTSTGATVHHTSPTKICDYRFYLPEYTVQKKVAEILTSYDTLIENSQKQIKLLEEAAQRIYKEWFVDLRFPGYEDVDLVDGVPEGWSKELIGNVIGKVSRTKQIKTADYLLEGSIPIIDQSRDFIAGYTNDSEALVNTGTPVIVFGDHTRILKYIQFPFAKGADGTQLIISDRTNMPQSLLYLSLIAVDLSNYHYARHFKYLKAESILIPSQDVADEFDRLISPILSQIQKLREKCYELSQARDRLLPKLMSGEIEV